MATTIIIAIIALAVGILAGILIAGRGKNALTTEKQTLEAQLAAANQSHATETSLLNHQLTEQKAEAAKWHVVKSGESQWSIAHKYGISVDQLRKMNKLTDKSVIQPGQKLRVKN